MLECSQGIVTFFMKLIHFLVLSLGLTPGWSAAAASSYDEVTGTGTVWAQGVSVNADGTVVGWYDANKDDPYDGDVDDLMCYAACAANLIAWWQSGEYGKNLTSTAPRKLDAIWERYKESNVVPDMGGDPAAAINWWLSGVYSPASESDWKRYYAEKMKEYVPQTHTPFSGYYYDQYGLTSNDLSDLIFDAWIYGEWSKDGGAEIDFRAMFESGAGISLAIFADTSELAHAITLWGVEYENGNLTKLWVTDSDDYWVTEPSLFSATVETREGKIYITGTDYDMNETEDGTTWSYYGDGVYIDTVYAIRAAASANWQLVPEPATVTLSLLAFAGLAVRRRRGGR